MSATIPTAAATWNLAEYHASAARVTTLPAQLCGWVCTPELARIWAHYQAGRLSAAEAKAQIQDLMQAELDDMEDAQTRVLHFDVSSIPTRNPILDSAIDSLEAQAAEADALLTTYAAQGRQNSPGVDELKYQRSIRNLSRKAADLLRVEGLPTQNRGGWLVTSGRNTYVVSDDTPRTCDCRAGREGLRCKHKLAVEAVARVQAVQQRKAA